MHSPIKRCPPRPRIYGHTTARCRSLTVSKSDLMSVREATRKQFWRLSKNVNNLAPMHSRAAGSVLFWIYLNHLMTPSATAPARIKMKDDAIFSRPNTQGVCTPILQPSTMQEQYLLRVYRALAHACHLHESLPDALFLTCNALIRARNNVKRNVPPGTNSFVCFWDH